MLLTGSGPLVCELRVGPAEGFSGRLPWVTGPDGVPGWLGGGC
jgi:hypothetical protein